MLHLGRLTAVSGRLAIIRDGMLAAQSDGRIKALATVNAVCVGIVTRNGGLHKENSKESPEAIAGALQGAGQWCTREASEGHSEAPPMFSTNLDEVPEDADSFSKDAAAYYGTKRGKHERSDKKVPPMSYDLMVCYDVFVLQHLISLRPLLMIADANAQTLHFSEVAMRIAKEPKEPFIVDRKNHFELYDDLEKAGPKVVDFFEQYP